MLIYYCDFASVEVVIKNYLLTYLLNLLDFFRSVPHKLDCGLSNFYIFTDT